VAYTRDSDGWITAYDAEARKGSKPIFDLIDAKTGKVVVEAGQKISPRKAKLLAEEGLSNLRVSDDELIGRFLADELVSTDTGEIFAEAGDEITEELLPELLELGYTYITVLDIVPVNKGPFIRNPLVADKSPDKLSALEEIYRVMRPGEPPPPATAQALFDGLFFAGERYGLSAVGRVNMDIRLNQECPDDVRVLRKEDIVGVVKTLVGLRDGRGEIDDIDKDRKSTRLNSSHSQQSRMPSSA